MENLKEIQHAGYQAIGSIDAVRDAGKSEKGGISDA